MTKEQKPGNVILYEEAGEVTRKIADERLAAFVNFGLITVLFRRGMDPGVVPQVDFDLRFFAEALRAMASDRQTLMCIFQGDLGDLKWWP